MRVPLHGEGPWEAGVVQGHVANTRTTTSWGASRTCCWWCRGVRAVVFHEPTLMLMPLGEGMGRALWWGRPPARAVRSRTTLFIFAATRPALSTQLHATLHGRQALFMLVHGPRAAWVYLCPIRCWTKEQLPPHAHKNATHAPPHIHPQHSTHTRHMPHRH